MLVNNKVDIKEFVSKALNEDKIEEGKHIYWLMEHAEWDHVVAYKKLWKELAYRVVFDYQDDTGCYLTNEEEETACRMVRDKIKKEYRQ